VKAEARAVAGAGDGLALDLAAAEQAAAMRAAIVQRMQVTVVPEQQNGRVARHRADRLAILKLARLDRRPVAGSLVERRLIDTDSAA
jgi:hypothetical protein